MVVSGWIKISNYTSKTSTSPPNLINKSLNIMVQTVRYKRISKFNTAVLVT